MNYIKFEHTSGIAIVNLDRIFRLSVSGSNLLVYSDATANVSFSFSSAADALNIRTLIEKVSTTIDLDSLANQ